MFHFGLTNINEGYLIFVLFFFSVMISRKEIAFCDSRGQLGLLDNVTQQQGSTQPTDDKVIIMIS